MDGEIKVIVALACGESENGPAMEILREQAAKLPGWQ